MTEKRQKPTSTTKKPSPKARTAKTANRTVEVTAQEAGPAAEDASAVDEGRAQLQAFVEANEAIMASMATLSSEMAAFGTRRLNENIERNHSLLGCRDPEEMLRIQSQFIEAATRQYIDQVNTVIGIVNEMANAVWSPLGTTWEGTTKEDGEQDR